MVRRRLEGWKIDEIAEALQVNEKTVDRWCSIHSKYGWEGLRVKSKAPYTY
jgi:transposase